MSELLDVRNPRTGAIDYRICVAGRDDIRCIADELRDMQPGWFDAGVAHRAEVMRAFVRSLRSNDSEILAALETDTGRRSIARSELAGVCAGIERWCDIAPGLLDQKESPASALPHVGIRQRQEPYPLVGVISPWNFPLLLSFIDAIPALLAGCAVIIKPSEVTPRFAAPVARCIGAIPELHAVLRLLSGDGRSGSALIPLVDAIAFTGSVTTGRKVAAAAAEAFIPAFLELGGKDPVIVLPGADVDRATTAILRASVAATGQACQSLERIYVQADIHDEFVDSLVAKAQQARLSYPDPDEGIIGPLIFEKQADTIRDHLEDATRKGAKICCGGEVRELGGGLWIEPTVVTGVRHDMRLMREETFGPIMPVMRFDRSDEAVWLANDSDYGLSAAVFAAGEDEALEVAAKLRAGGISINDAGLTTMIFDAPKSAFGLSGMGPSRMGPTGLTRFFRQKALYINRGDVLPIEIMAEGEASGRAAPEK